MKTKHTPGPWHTYTSGNTRDCVESVKEGKFIAVVYDGADSRPCENNPTQSANAKLIAAVPELLAALELLVTQSANLCEVAGQFVPVDASFQKALSDARAAIAKAT
jgi:hypothetical protein